MGFLYTGKNEKFIAGAESPSPGEAIINLDDPIVLYSPELGTVALGCLKVNPQKPDSAIIIGDNKDNKGPSHIELREAVAVILPISNDMQLRQGIINGIYTGPKSELSIR